MDETFLRYHKTSEIIVCIQPGEARRQGAFMNKSMIAGKEGRNGRLQVYQSREFYFSFKRMEFSRGDRRLELSAAEQKLLQLLVENRGRTLSGEELVADLRAAGYAYVDGAVLLTAMRALRDKLEENPEIPCYLLSVSGGGYTWADCRGRTEGPKGPEF